MPDYIPRRDHDLLLWATSFTNWCQGNGVANGLTPLEIAELADLVGSFNAQLGSNALQRATLNSGVQAKRAIRRQARRQNPPPQGHHGPAPRTPRPRLGRPPAAEHRRRPSPPPKPAPSRRWTPDPLAHTLRIADSATPTRRAKPRGVRLADLAQDRRPQTRQPRRRPLHRHRDERHPSATRSRAPTPAKWPTISSAGSTPPAPPAPGAKSTPPPSAGCEAAITVPPPSPRAPHSPSVPSVPLW